MRVHLRFLAIWIIGTLILYLPSLTQAKKEDIISFTGVIEDVASDFQSIVVNERRIMILPSETEIVDEKRKCAQGL